MWCHSKLWQRELVEIKLINYKNNFWNVKGGQIDDCKLIVNLKYFFNDFTELHLHNLTVAIIKKDLCVHRQTLKAFYLNFAGTIKDTFFGSKVADWSGRHGNFDMQYGFFKFIEGRKQKTYWNKLYFV